MYKALEFCGDVCAVEQLDSKTVYTGTDEYGKWRFDVMFGNTSNYVTFAFGHTKWVGRDGAVETLLIRVDEPDYPLIQYRLAMHKSARDNYLDRFEGFKQIKNYSDLKNYGGELASYWHEFFPKFALADRVELKGFAFGKTSEEWERYLNNRMGVTKSSDAMQSDWLSGHAWDYFLVCLKCDFEAEEIDFVSPALRMPTVLEILKDRQEANDLFNESVKDEIQRILLEHLSGANRNKTNVSRTIKISDRL